MKYDDIDNFVDGLFSGEDQQLNLSESDLFPDDYNEPEEQSYSKHQSTPSYTPLNGRYGWEDDLDDLAYLAGYPSENGNRQRDDIIYYPVQNNKVSFVTVFFGGFLLVGVVGTIILLSTIGLI